MEKEINNNNLYKIKVYYFLMSLFRRLTVEEKNIKDLLKVTKKLISFKTNPFVFDSNVFVIKSKLKDYSGKYKDYFLKKLENVNSRYKESLGYNLRDIPAI